MIVCNAVSRSKRVGDNGVTYSSNERVRETGSGISELVKNLLKVTIEPTTLNVRDAVEVGDAGLRKDTSQKISHDAANGMGCEDLYCWT
jgi:hypothetical protein